MPPKIKKSLVAVSGSLAIDCVMNFPGRFSEHIIPGKIHDLSLSFLLNQLSPGFGGTAGNIAYNLALLGERSAVLTAVGVDFVDYRRHLSSLKINLCGLSVDRRSRGAAAYIMTDADDNQIAGFYPGPTALPRFDRLRALIFDYLIISPDVKPRMLAAQVWARQNGLPYIFDPGQQVINFSAVELKKMIAGSFLTIGNDYEIEVIRRALNLDHVSLISPGKNLIITKGAQGSEIIKDDQRTLIAAVRTDRNLDPTGAGDAYRAGLLKGLMAGFNIEQAARLASVVAVYAVEKKGTQNHHFTIKNLEKRYRQSFGHALKLT